MASFIKNEEEDEAVKKLSIHNRLRSKISLILRTINKPLHEIVRDNALRYLPVKSLLRFRSVSASWNRHVSSLLFLHTQSYTHLSLSGLFTNSPLSCFPLDPTSHSIPDPTFSFLPYSEITILSSSHGLICCVADGTYVICNPSTMQWTPLPKQKSGRAANSNAVIVFRPSVYNFRSDYFVICPFEIGSGSGVFGFDVFESESRNWRTSKETCSAEEIVTGSGVSAADVAYWRTSVNTVASYDLTADRARSVIWPAGEADTWQLSDLGGRLCAVSVAGSDLTVHELRSDLEWAPLSTDGWEQVKEDMGVDMTGNLWPLRSQSANLELMVWVDWRVMVFDLVGQRVKYICHGVPAASKEDYVSYISTFASVHRQIGCIAASPPVPPPLPPRG